MVKGATNLLEVLLVVVIGLALVSTVATSTSSASTALAPFAGAQSLVIIVPLIFVAIILFAAILHIRGGKKAQLEFDYRLTPSLIRLLRAFVRVWHQAYVKSLRSVNWN